jgi:hypothetical protein
LPCIRTREGGAMSNSGRDGLPSRIQHLQLRIALKRAGGV